MALLIWTAWTQTEFVGEEALSYRFRAGQRIAMRQGSAVSYLYGEHLGSTSLVSDASGVAVTETRDPLTRAGQPYGQPYWQWGATRTDFGFTPSGENTLRVQAGQRLDGFGLMDYNARYYSSTLGRFIPPDSIIPQPGSPLAWDRYEYVYSNPINYTDPSGHMRITEGDDYDRFIQPVIPKPYYYNSGITEGDEPSTQLGHTLYYEGGGDNAGIAVNIMQTLHNRAYNAWNCSIEHCNNAEWAKLNPGLIPWEKITPAQYTRLLLYLASTPYTGDAGGVHPAYNGWETPRDVEVFKQNPVLSNLFSGLVAISNEWLYILPGTDPLSAPITYKGYEPDYRLRNANVMYFCSTTVDLRDSLPNVPYDESSDGRFQFYSTVPLNLP